MLVNIVELQMAYRINTSIAITKICGAVLEAAHNKIFTMNVHFRLQVYCAWYVSSTSRCSAVEPKILDGLQNSEILPNPAWTLSLAAYICTCLKLPYVINDEAT